MNNNQDAKGMLAILLGGKRGSINDAGYGMNPALAKLLGLKVMPQDVMGMSKLDFGIPKSSNSIPADDRSQVPRLAEGGEVQEPRAMDQAPRASQSWTPPSVQARQTALTPIFAPNEVPAGYQGRYIDPTVLSSSQQYARDREAQDAALASAYSSVGAQSPRGREYRQAQQAMRRGELTIDDLKTKVSDPIFESRVRNAYAAIGRTGGVTANPLVQTAEGYKQVSQPEINYYLDQYKSGALDPKEFEKIFLTEQAAKANIVEAAGKTPAVANPYAATAATMLGKLGTPELPPAPKKGFTTPLYLAPGNPIRFFEEGGDVQG